MQDAMLYPGQSAELVGEFRTAMRQLAASASLITTGSRSGDAAGMTATAVCSLSMFPPSLLVCINQTTRTHSLLRTSERFCVNIVGAEDRQLCELFGSGPTTRRRFSTDNWSRDEEGVPLLKTALANIICLLDRQLDYNTHTIFVGRVQNVLMQQRSTPLLYHDGNYGTFEAIKD